MAVPKPTDTRRRDGSVKESQGILHYVYAMGLTFFNLYVWRAPTEVHLDVVPSSLLESEEVDLHLVWGTVCVKYHLIKESLDNTLDIK